ANNQSASAGAFHIDVDKLTLGVPRTLNPLAGKDQLFQIDVSPGQTLRVSLSGAAGLPEVLLRGADLPSDMAFDAVSVLGAQGTAFAIVPTTSAATYYILVRGATGTPNLLAEVLPFQMTDVSADRGGDERYVTMTIRGAQFSPQAIVQLVL